MPEEDVHGLGDVEGHGGLVGVVCFFGLLWVDGRGLMYGWGGVGWVVG